MKKRILSVILCMAMILSCLTGCGGSSGESKSEGEGEKTSEAEGESKDRDNILHFQIETAVDSMDPQFTSAFSVLAQCMEGLLTKDADGNVIKALAEDEQVSEDGLTYTFTIREDAKWSNGDPVTADDFVFGFQRLADPNIGSDYQFFVQVACFENADEIVDGAKDITELGVEAVDDRTFVCHLKNPCAIFDKLMTFPSFFPVNRSFFEECGDKFATSADTILCNGPFVITSYEPAAITITADKNESYYDADAVAIDGVEWNILQDIQTVAMSYEEGSLDAALLTGDLIEKYKDDPAFTTVNGSFLWYLSANMEKEGLDNIHIRTAIAKAVDKAAICDSVLKDGSTPADSIIPAELAISPDGKDFRAQAGDGYEQFTYDVEAAQAEWQEGLKEIGKDSLSFDLVCEDSETPQLVAQFIQSQLETNLEGLSINLVVEPRKARLEDMREGNYDIGLTRWGADYADPMTYLDMFVSGSSTNYMNYSNTKYDEIIASAQSGELAMDENARWDALVGAEKMLADDVVLMPLYFLAEAYLINPSVTGIHFYSTGAVYGFKDVQIN